MTKLEYKFTNDILFKSLFTKYTKLLERLVSELLSIPYESIKDFRITNPEIQADEPGKKFCKLDINMAIDGRIVDLEVQVSNEGNYPERSLFYWAREFSTGLNERDDYSLAQQTIIISILGFNLFPDPQKYHSEYQALEVTSHEPLTDKMILHYYELKKLTPLSKIDTGRELWLKLFNAETEEDLAKIEEMGVPVMNEARAAYRKVTATEEFRNMERARLKASHDEAQALANERRKTQREDDEKYKVIIDAKDAELADKDAELADKDAELAGKDAIIEQLRKAQGASAQLS